VTFANKDSPGALSEIPVLHQRKAWLGGPIIISLDIRSYLNNLVGQRVLVNVAACEEAKGKILAVDPTTDLPAETMPDTIRVAIDRSQFTVRFDNGGLLDVRNT
jgi:hypothetical protein